jgi:methionine-rich copper-binding protein CopC
MRRTVRAALAGVAAVGFVLAVAAPASAHNYIVSSTPAEGEVLTELPEAWELVTNESLLYVGNDEVFGLLVRDADNLYYGDGCVDVSGARMSADPVIGEPGGYTLVFSFISADGHPLTGEIPFEWAPSGEFEAATGSAAVPRCGGAEEAPESAPEIETGGGIPSDLLWIGGAVLAVALAVVVALALGRRGSRPRS